MGETDDAEEGLKRRLGELVRRDLGARAAAVEPLAGGLGTRRFFRVHTDGAPSSLVARVERPEDPAGRPEGVAPEPPLEPLRAFLEAAGLPVPRRLGGDPERGIDLLEDLGEESLADAARAEPARRPELYAQVCAWIPRLQSLTDPGDLPAFRRRLDAALLDYKAELFTRWSLPVALGRAPRLSEGRAVRDAFAAVAEACAEAPARLAHRDLQSHNVLVRREVGRPPRLGLIDLQGAFLAPPEYDLVCLLRDSYVQLPDAELEAQLAAVRPALPDAPDPPSFGRRFDLLTLTRKGKDHARFLFAAVTRGDHRYLRFVPATVRSLQRAATRVAGSDPRLARLAELVAALPATEEPPPCAP